MPGAINVNTLEQPIRRRDYILSRGPLIQGDIRRVPLVSESADEVVGNHLPASSSDEWAGQICREAHRILKPGGVVKFNSHGGGQIWLEWLNKAGFQDVRLEVQYAIGYKK